MEIRFAQEKDIGGILCLLRQVGQVHHEIRPDLFRSGAIKYTREELKRILADESSPIFVGTEEDKVLGYCFCQIRQYRSSTVLTDRKELYIDDLCVDESCRGRHVGKQLYDHTCAWAKSIGCNFVTLNVWCGNDNAMTFYEKRGLTPRSVTMEVSLEDTKC